MNFIQQLAQLPDEAKLAISSLLTTGLLALFVLILNKTGIDLRGYAETLAAVLSPIIIGVIEFYLNFIPPAFDSLVLAVIHLILLFVLGVGSFLILRKRRIPSLR